MSKILKARIRFDHKFNDGEGGVAIDIWDDAGNEWGLCTLFQFNDGVYVHSTIINKINEMIDMGYTFVNE